MPDAEPNRKWFQFSLRLLLLVVVAGNVFWWAFQTHLAEHRRRIVAEAELGGWNDFRQWLAQVDKQDKEEGKKLDAMRRIPLVALARDPELESFEIVGRFTRFSQPEWDTEAEAHIVANAFVRKWHGDRAMKYHGQEVKDWYQEWQQLQSQKRDLQRKVDVLKFENAGLEARLAVFKCVNE